MANVSYIIFCKKATNIEGHGPSANSILTAITPEYIPGLFTFSVIVSILGVSEGDNKFSFDFTDPEKRSVVHIEANLPTPPDKSNIPEEFKGINIAMDWTNVDFKISGLYTFNVLLNDEPIGNKTIFVKGRNE